MSECYLTTYPNSWGCHDPQCGDSTWDHDCPVGPCTRPECSKGEPWPMPWPEARDAIEGLAE